MLSEEEKKAIKELIEIKELSEEDLKFDDYEVTAILDKTDLKSLIIVLNLIEKQREDYETILDLYNKEKEKNLLFKGATIIANLENDGIEINMNANKLVELYLEEKQRNEQLLNSKVGIDLSYDDYISKDKIKAKIEIRKEEKENCRDCIEEKYILREIYVLQSLLEEDK